MFLITIYFNVLNKLMVVLFDHVDWKIVSTDGFIVIIIINREPSIITGRMTNVFPFSVHEMYWLSDLILLVLDVFNCK